MNGLFPKTKLYLDTFLPRDCLHYHNMEISKFLLKYHLPIGLLVGTIIGFLFPTPGNLNIYTVISALSTL